MHLSGATLLAWATVASAASVPIKIGDVVKTTSGQIKGHASSWQPTVSEYLGIPFAQPPVGPLRWRKPVAFTSNAIFNADKYSADCPANPAPLVQSKEQINSTQGIVFASLAQYGRSLDEDCLTLNVWSKSGSGGKAKAVLLWIYGGGFALGSNASPSYNGARLAAEQDVIVVNMNYRVTIMGFPNAPGLPDQNLGLLDQRLAVEWVRDNIAAFGGDPNRITLSGQSSGAASVDYYSYAWTKDPIIAGLIMEAGSTSVTRGTDEPTNTRKNWYAASEKLGCGNREVGDKTVDCMRSKPWKEVLDAIKPAASDAAQGGMGNFNPKPDGKMVFTNNEYKELAALGKFIKRPTLVGNNKNELSLFIVLENPKTVFTAPLPSAMANTFSCPSGIAAKARLDNNVKVWRFLYSAEWPNQQIAKGAGAWHGSETSMIFGTTEYQQQYYSRLTNQTISFPDTDEQKKLSKTMMTAWASFAKDPEHGLQNLGWPVYDLEKPTVTELGGPDSSVVRIIDLRGVDKDCANAGSIGNVLGPGLAGVAGTITEPAVPA